MPSQNMPQCILNIVFWLSTFELIDTFCFLFLIKFASASFINYSSFFFDWITTGVFKKKEMRIQWDENIYHFDSVWWTHKYTRFYIYRNRINEWQPPQQLLHAFFLLCPLCKITMRKDGGTMWNKYNDIQ